MCKNLLVDKGTFSVKGPSQSLTLGYHVLLTCAQKVCMGAFILKAALYTLKTHYIT